MTEEREGQARTDGDVKHDRRRPGRVDYSHPSLIRMLRGSFDTDQPSPEDGDLDASSPDAASEELRVTDSTDDLGPSRGIAFGIALVAPIWALIIAAVWLLWGRA